MMLSTDNLFAARLSPLLLLDQTTTPSRLPPSPASSSPPTSATYQNALLLKEYCRFFISQCEQGKKLSDPTHLYGVDQIQPHSSTRYTKPILMVINEKELSAADFSPAILQDAGRITLIGNRTAGAGGCVMRASYPNSVGMSFFSYTSTIGLRKDNLFIENEGVSPTIPLKLTAEDFKQNFRPYANSINQEMRNLLKNP